MTTLLRPTATSAVLAIALGLMSLIAAADADARCRTRTAVCNEVVLAAQKVGSPTTSAVRVQLASVLRQSDARKRPVAITVAFPRGTTYARRGAACTPEQAVGDECPKDALLGGGLSWWTIWVDDVPYACDAGFYSGGVEAWNAASWRGYVIGMRFDLGCSPCSYCGVLFTGKFKRNVLTIRFPNLDKTAEGAQAAMDLFTITLRGQTKAGVPLLRTPRRCNRDVGWKSVVRVRFEDGSSKRFKPERHRCHR